MRGWRRAATSVSLALSVGSLTFGCMTGGADPPEELHGDLQCADTSADSPTALACDADCTRDCGFNGSPNYPRGVKYCVCQSGIFIECRCPRADWYKGAPSAPFCDKVSTNGTGRTQFVDNQHCDKEFDQCIARDPVTGNTPKGCACLDKVGNGELTWECASTEKWFYPEQ